jgi:SPP1 gp7 family putative phage head morphogenesis protein
METVDFDAARRIEEMLNDYGRLLGPWAESVGRRMLEEVSSRDARIWSELGRELGIGLRREIEAAPTGALFQEALARQVHLITSLPFEAAERVHHLATEALITGGRAKEIAAEIMKSGEVSLGRANTIARTETGRVSTELLKARSEHIGSPGYIWSATMDADTRKRHRELNGKFIRWDTPPIASEPGQKEMRYHAGAGPECRCIPRVVLPELWARAA